MSLTTANPAEIVKKQYFFKLKANIDAFSSLLGIQLLAILFSLGATSSISSNNNGFSVDIKYYSADVVIAFTMIWGFVTAITITTKPYRHNDFTFVTNRITSNISNMLFLLTASIIGGVTAMLAKNVTVILTSIFFHSELYGPVFQVKEFIIGLFVSILYIYFISSLGYLIGTFVQVNRIFILLLPVLMIGSLFIDGMAGKEPTIMHIFQFYFMEPSLLIFTIKAVATTALLFIASITILNRMEVRK